MELLSAVVLASATFPESNGYTLFWYKLWPKKFKCGSMNIVGAMLAVEVIEFVAKDSYICDVVQYVQVKTNI